MGHEANRAGSAGQDALAVAVAKNLKSWEHYAVDAADAAEEEDVSEAVGAAVAV